MTRACWTGSLPGLEQRAQPLGGAAGFRKAALRRRGGGDPGLSYSTSAARAAGPLLPGEGGRPLPGRLFPGGPLRPLGGNADRALYGPCGSLPLGVVSRLARLCQGKSHPGTYSLSQPGGPGGTGQKPCDGLGGSLHPGAVCAAAKGSLRHSGVEPRQPLSAERGAHGESLSLVCPAARRGGGKAMPLT